jgi:hypothetical protein
MEKLGLWTGILYLLIYIIYIVAIVFSTSAATAGESFVR